MLRYHGDGWWLANDGTPSPLQIIECKCAASYPLSFLLDPPLTWLHHVYMIISIIAPGSGYAHVAEAYRKMI